MIRAHHHCHIHLVGVGEHDVRIISDELLSNLVCVTCWWTSFLISCGILYILDSTFLMILIFCLFVIWLLVKLNLFPRDTTDLTSRGTCISVKFLNHMKSYVFAVTDLVTPYLFLYSLSYFSSIVTNLCS